MVSEPRSRFETVYFSTNAARRQQESYVGRRTRRRVEGAGDGDGVRQVRRQRFYIVERDARRSTRVVFVFVSVLVQFVDSLAPSRLPVVRRDEGLPAVARAQGCGA